MSGPDPATPALPDPVEEYRARVRQLTGADPVAPRPGQAGDTDWAVWEFSEPQWRRFLAVEALRLLLLLGRNVLVVLVVLAIACGFFGVTSALFAVLRGLPREWPVWGPVAIAVIGAYLAWRLVPLARGPHQVRISPQRVIAGARHTSLQEGTQELRGVRLLTGRPARVVFRTHSVSERFSGETPFYGLYETLFTPVTQALRQRTIVVPVPAGREAEAAALVRQFAAAGLVPAPSG